MSIHDKAPKSDREWREIRERRNNRILELQDKVESLERQLAATQALLESQAQTANDEFIKLWNERDTLRQSLQRAEMERDNARQAFADQIIARLAKVESDASEHYKTPNFRVVQNVCHDLKWFVGDLLKKPLPASDVDKPEGDTNA